MTAVIASSTTQADAAPETFINRLGPNISSEVVNFTISANATFEFSLDNADTGISTVALNVSAVDGIDDDGYICINVYGDAHLLVEFSGYFSVGT